jgi:hypothetical protein
MKKTFAVCGLVISSLLASCAAHMDGYSRGFFASTVGENGYYVSYGDPALFSSAQSAEIYWLYNCAKLTLMRGYDGFRFESEIKMSDSLDPGVVALGGYGTLAVAGLLQGPVKSDFQDNITMLRKPFDPSASRVFDASTVMKLLGPCVEGNEDSSACAQALKSIAQVEYSMP